MLLWGAGVHRSSSTLSVASSTLDCCEPMELVVWLEYGQSLPQAIRVGGWVDSSLVELGLSLRPASFPDTSFCSCGTGLVTLKAGSHEWRLLLGFLPFPMLALPILCKHKAEGSRAQADAHTRHWNFKPLLLRVEWSSS